MDVLCFRGDQDLGNDKLQYWIVSYCTYACILWTLLAIQAEREERDCVILSLQKCMACWENVSEYTKFYFHLTLHQLTPVNSCVLHYSFLKCLKKKLKIFIANFAQWYKFIPSFLSSHCYIFIPVYIWPCVCRTDFGVSLFWLSACIFIRYAYCVLQHDSSDRHHFGFLQLINFQLWVHYSVWQNLIDDTW